MLPDIGDDVTTIERFDPFFFSNFSSSFLIILLSIVDLLVLPFAFLFNNFKGRFTLPVVDFSPTFLFISFFSNAVKAVRRVCNSFLSWSNCSLALLSLDLIFGASSS